LDDTDIAYLDVEEKQFAKRQLQFGDLILEKSGGGPKQPVGRVIAFEKTEGLFSFSNFTSVIRVVDPSVLSFRFLHRLLHWYYESGVTEGMQRRSTGIRNLDFNSYKQLQVPMPLLIEQERIVAILDEAFAAIATATVNAEKNLANARKLFESALNRIFSQKGEAWIEKRLGEVVDISHGFAFKGPTFRNSDDESKPIVLTPGNYTENATLLFNQKNTKRLSAPIPERYLFDVGDLTIVMTDLSSKMKILGKPAFIDRPNILHNQRIGRLLFADDSVLPKFVFYYLRTKPVSDAIRATATGTMVRHTAPKRILCNHICFPKQKTEQWRVVAQLESLNDRCEHIEAVYHRELTKLVELKQSLLHEAFTGRLTADAKSADRNLKEANI